MPETASESLYPPPLSPYRAACAKAWELFRWCTSSFPPTATVAAPLTQYFESLCNAQGLEADVRDLVLGAWTSLDHAVQVRRP